VVAVDGSGLAARLDLSIIINWTESDGAQVSNEVRLVQTPTIPLINWTILLELS